MVGMLVCCAHGGEMDRWLVELKVVVIQNVLKSGHKVKTGSQVETRNDLLRTLCSFK